MSKLLYGAGEYAELLEAARAVQIPDAQEWLNSELISRGVKIEDGKILYFTKAIHGQIVTLLNAWEDAKSAQTEQTPEERPEACDVVDLGSVAPVSDTMGDIDMAAVFGAPASSDADPIEHVDAEPVENESATQSEPARHFDVSKAVFDEEGVLLNEEECWRISGMQPPAVNIELEDKVRFVKRVIRHLQVEIDDITSCASAEIKERVGAINFLMSKYTHIIKEVDIPKLKKGKKSFREGSLGVFFRKTGGPKCIDRDAVAIWLARQPEDVQRQLKAEWKLSFDVRDLYPFAESMKIPGISIVAPDEYGKLSIGADKAWSANKAIERVKASVEVLGKIAKDEEGAEG
ncbi:MAG: hypothetical protein K2X77_18390 [Candidatus Obscuribacterales bacterium]|nr:hypothetical protein [Candidatus Obscuribacterales bacterium]